jgi:DNA-binding transcriptional ArsR family regulator
MSDVRGRSNKRPGAAAPPAPAGRLDYDVADVVEADTAERMKALGDPLRLTVLDLVLEHAMSVTELAERLDRPKGTVAHHVAVLVDAGLLRVVRTRKVRAIEERLYGRTGRVIAFQHGPGSIPFLDHVLAQADLDAIADPDCPGAFTFPHARIAADRVKEFADRLYALGLEFADLPRDGDVEYGMYLALFPTTRRIAPRSPQR